MGQADIFGVYFPRDQTVYLVPIGAVAESEGRLRLEPTRNNQKRGIRFAVDFQIDRWSVGSLCEIVQAGVVSDEPALSVA